MRLELNFIRSSNTMYDALRSDDAEDLEAGLLDVFVDVDARHVFARKVFSLLSLQLSLTFAIVCIFRFYDPVRSYVDVNDPNAHAWPIWLACFASFGTLIALSCFRSVARAYPTNYAFLTVFTLAEGVLLGTVCAAYDASAIVAAVGVTVFLTAALVVFASQTTYDFTSYGPYLFVALVCSLLFSSLLMLFPYFRTEEAQTGWAFLGVVLFSFYVVYDVQLILGGKSASFQFDENDHVLATLSVYLDVVNLFLRILRIIDSFKRR